MIGLKGGRPHPAVIVERGVLTDDEPPLSDTEPADLAPAKIIDLEEWCVPVADSEQSMDPPPLPTEQAQEVETAEAGWTLPTFYFARPSQPVREVKEIQLALDFG